MNTYDVYWSTGANPFAYYEGVERGLKAEDENGAEKLAKFRIKIQSKLTVKVYKIVKV